MDDVGYLLGGLAVLGFTVQGLLSRVDRSTRKFPWCKTCGSVMKSFPLLRVFPDEVQWYLDKHKLPPVVVSRFKCPKSHYQLWYIPRLGNTEKPFFLREEL